ncbi:hypothetical protein CMUS01_07243 [Colletotrichum musicola]|uniref:Uncharacterized protein n=1 Tax=Colletotrichum musicola TaxID=2175873 RepID=A0A8H6KIH2_9PEZI|nr:hypothetical protein CMUS01_07243 [Colletotrichum musicola]
MRSSSRNKRQGPANIPDGRPGQGQQRLRSGPASFRFRGERPLGFSSIDYADVARAEQHIPCVARDWNKQHADTAVQTAPRTAGACLENFRPADFTRIENENDRPVVRRGHRKSSSSFTQQHPTDHPPGGNAYPVMLLEATAVAWCPHCRRHSHASSPSSTFFPSSLPPPQRSVVSAYRQTAIPPPGPIDDGLIATPHTNSMSYNVRQPLSSSFFPGPVLPHVVRYSYPSRTMSSLVMRESRSRLSAVPPPAIQLLWLSDSAPPCFAHVQAFP